MAMRDQQTSERRNGSQRPVPDEAQLEDSLQPQPEHHEQRLYDPGMGDLSKRDFVAIVKRAGKEMLDDNMTMFAQALAYSSFFAIPAVILLAIGLFTLLAGPATITSVINHLGGVMPGQAKTLLSGSIQRLGHQQRSSLVMVIVGAVLALWSTTGAMTSYMAALNVAYDRKDQRNFLKKWLTALVMVGCIGFAFVLVAVFLIFGPPIEKHVGNTLGIQSFLTYVWWAAQWPILIGGLLAAFATLLYLGPDVDQPRWRFLTLGSAIATFVWLAASGAFAYYTAKFGSYNKTWGSLSAVIIMLTWLWLSALALLFGAEVNAEAERSRELQQGAPAHRDPQAPSRA
jgi:membrane protein